MLLSIFIMIVFLVVTFTITRVIVAIRLHRDRLKHEAAMRRGSEVFFRGSDGRGSDNSPIAW